MKKGQMWDPVFRCLALLILFGFIDEGRNLRFRPYKKLKTPLIDPNTEQTSNAKEKFLDDLISRRRKTTFKCYRRGLERFEEFYQKDCDTILKEARQKQQSEDVTELSFFDRKIEAFYKWMQEKGYALTSAYARDGSSKSSHQLILKMHNPCPKVHLQFSFLLERNIESYKYGGDFR